MTLKSPLSHLNRLVNSLHSPNKITPMKHKKKPPVNSANIPSQL